MSKVSTFIADLGENANFVASVAHAGAAFILVEHLPGRPLVWALAMTGYALVKEYWFDATYEHNPPQTFWNNTLDFATYMVGAWSAYLVRIAG